jgi:hypothetical protein
MKRALVPALVALASTGVLVWLAHLLVPAPPHWVGHDYSYFLPYLVGGANWIRINGWLTPPFYTADFCGGMPWLGNPQSMVYSLPQWLALHTGPVSAVRWTLLLSATGGAVATWFLVRRCLSASVEAATLGFVLFQLSSFLLVRLAVGHLTFHAIAVVPAIAMLVLWPGRRSGLTRMIPVAGAAGLIAIAVYGGAMNLIVPMLLCVALIIAIAQRGSGLVRRPWLRLAGAACWAAALAAVKLVPAMQLAVRYPRAAPPALINSVEGYIATLLRGLFLPAANPAMTPIGSSGLSLGQYELDMGVTVLPALLLAVLIVPSIRRRIHRPRWAPFAVGGAICAIVVALTFGSRTWAATLHHLPVINNNTVLTRWWVIFTVGIIVGAALAFDRIATSHRARTWLLAASVVVIVAQSLMRNYGVYTSPIAYPSYDPMPAERASILARSGGLPAITAIARPDASRQSRGIPLWAQNDGVFQGASDVPCYEPLFDRGLAAFDGALLSIGPIFKPEGDDHLNIADPRCYFRGNACSPGDLFVASESVVARRLAAHHPLGVAGPLWQRAATWLTAAATGGTFGYLVIVLLQLIRKRIRRNEAGNGEQPLPAPGN